MFFGMPGPMELIVILGLGGGMGLPLGVPPAPEDPLLAKVAPDECLFYTTWAGIAKPDPASQNRTEQLAAEPEVQHFFAELERRIKASFVEEAKRSEPDMVPFIEDASGWVKTVLTHPTAIFLSSVKMTDEGPDVRGGALVKVAVNAVDAAKLKASLEKYQAAFLKGKAQPVEIAGETWYRLKLDPEAPEITWGVRGKYLIVGLGEGSARAILERAVTPVPQWLTDLRKQLPVDRTSTVTYVNVRAILETVIPMVDEPEFEGFIEASGLSKVSSLASVTGLDKEAFVGRTLVGLSGEPSGLLSFVAAKPLTPGDLAPIPADATLALAARADADAIFETFLSLVGSVEPRGRDEIIRGVDEMNEELGIDLRNDILKAVGDTWCVYNSPGEGGLVFTGLTAVVPVKDHKSLVIAQAKLIAAAKAELAADEVRRRIYEEERRAEGRYYRRRPTPRIEQFQFAGKDVYFFNARGDVPFAPAWCLTQKELIFALFPQNIKAYLSRGGDFKSLATVPKVAGLFEGANGPVAVGYSDTPKLFELVYPLVPMFAQMMFSQLQRFERIDLDVSILPSAQSIRKHLRPGVAVLRRSQAGIELTTRQSLPGGGLGAAVPVMAMPWFLIGASMDRPMPPKVKQAPRAGRDTPEAPRPVTVPPTLPRPPTKKPAVPKRP